MKMDSIEMVKLLIEYSNQHQITLNMNEKNKNGDYPLCWAIHNKNIEIIKLLIEYALQHQIILEYNKNDIGENSEIEKLLQNYEHEKGKWEKVNKYINE